MIQKLIRYDLIDVQVCGEKAVLVDPVLRIRACREHLKQE